MSSLSRFSCTHPPQPMLPSEWEPPQVTGKASPLSSVMSPGDGSAIVLLYTIWEV